MDQVSNNLASNQIQPGQWVSSSTLAPSWAQLNVPPSWDIGQLVNDVNELKDLLKERTHINVSKDQENRICELEEAVGKLIESNKTLVEDNKRLMATRMPKNGEMLIPTEEYDIEHRRAAMATAMPPRERQRIEEEVWRMREAYEKKKHPESL